MNSCDCGRGTILTTKCIHDQLVSRYLQSFGSTVISGEDPVSFLVCHERDTDVLIFSVEKLSGSARHRSNKRTIVRFFVQTGTWRCSSCTNDQCVLFLPFANRRTCRHINEARDEASGLGLNVIPDGNGTFGEAAMTALASRHIIITNPVSYLPIPPPEWCRLSIDEDFPCIPFHAGRDLPPILQLDEDSRCSCGERGLTEEKLQSVTILYTSSMAMQPIIETSYCLSCRNTKGQIGPDLGKYGVFNWNNSVAFSHELLNSYTSHFTTSETPFYSFHQTVQNAYIAEQSPKPFCSLRMFLSAWFAFVRLQKLGSDMRCTQCGDNPSTVIADGISISFPRHRVRDLKPPTLSDKSVSQVRIQKTSVKSTCFVGSHATRLSIQKALNDENNRDGKERLSEICQAQVGLAQIIDDLFNRSWLAILTILNYCSQLLNNCLTTV